MTEPTKRRGGRRPGMTDEQRRAEVQTMLRMRRSGASYQAIADHFGLAKESCFEKIKRELQDLPKEDAAALRTIEVARLDYMESKLQPAIAEGHVPSINAARLLGERRATLLGLDMPQEHRVFIDQDEASIADQIVAEFQATLSAETAQLTDGDH